MNSTDVMDMLADQEEAIAGLYTEFARAIPEQAVYWNRLVNEERAHADVARALKTVAGSAGCRINASRFPVQAILTNIDSIKRQTSRVAEEGITAIRALAAAADLEHSLIEAGYFRVIESNNPEVLNELQALDAHTVSHAALIDSKLHDTRSMEKDTE